MDDVLNNWDKNIVAVEDGEVENPFSSNAEVSSDAPEANVFKSEEQKPKQEAKQEESTE